MLRELRAQVNALLADTPVRRKPALRRSDAPGALLATDLPHAADEAATADFIARAEAAQWSVRRAENGWLLLDKPVLPASLNFDDEYLYFRLFTDQKIDGTEEGKDIYRMSKADPSQVEKIATLDQTAYMTFTVPGRDVLFVNTYPYGSGVYVMDSDGSNLRKLEMP